MKQRFLSVVLLIPLLIFSSCGKTGIDSNMDDTASPASVEQPDPEGSLSPFPEFSSDSPEPTPTVTPAQTQTPNSAPTPASTPTPSPTPAPTQTSENSEKQQFNDTAVISEDGKTITVHNAYELLLHMASDRHFLLLPGDYDIYRTPFAEPYKPVMKNLHNVIIEGVGDKQIDFLTNKIDYDLLDIESCKDIAIINLYLGHSPKVEYECAGSVLCVSQCQGLTIKNCTLFGCGEYGIIGYDIADLLIQDSTFLDCKVDLINVLSCENIVMENCYFYNDEDELIEFERCRNIVIRNCELIGEFTQFPSIKVDRNDIIEYPSDGNTYVISDMKYPWGMLENVSVTGNKWFKEASEKITALYEGVAVDFKKGTDYYNESSYIIFILTYKAPLPETEFLNQINGVLSIAGEYIKDNTIVAVEIDWPGGPTPEIYHSYSNKTFIHTAYDSLSDIMQDGRSYLSADEAKELLYRWLPPVINSDDMKPRYEENIEIKLINTEIDGMDAYYLFEISNKDNIMFVLDVNAVNGSINDLFGDNDHAEASHASTEQIQAVLGFLAEEELEMSNDVNWRAYIVNKNYLFLISSQGDSMGPFRLFEKDGILKAEWYHDYSYYFYD